MVADVKSTIKVEPTEPEQEDEVEQLRYEIASYPADYTLSVMFEKWEAGQIVIPDVQRSFVWTKTQASRLIESFLLGLPVPGIFLYRETPSQKLLVVDGHQRLGSIAFFKKGVFKDDRVFRLENVDNRWNGKAYKDLSEADRIRLDDSILRATIIQQLNPDDNSSIYSMFERLNAGGTKLNPMEIRKSLFMDEAFPFIDHLNRNQNWRTLLGRPRIDPRLKDTELVLRVLALARKWKDYERPMKQFLTDYMKTLKGDKGKDRRMADEAFFVRACQVAVDHLPDRPFHVRTRLNLAALDAGLATIGSLNGDQASNLKKRFKQLQERKDYEEAIRFNTSDRKVVLERFQIAKKVLTS